LTGEEPRVLAEVQVALRRVATLVARGAAPEEVFAVVVEEVGELLPVDHAGMGRYEPDGSITVVASWGTIADHFPVGSRWTLDGRHPASLVFESGRPIRIDDYADASGPVSIGPLAADLRETGIRSAIGSPIIVEGRLWGVMGAGSSLEQPLPADTEARLASFTELLAAAIANAESRAGLTGLAEQQAALRRVATLVAQGAAPEEVFAAVVEEVGHLLSVEHAGMGRYEPDGSITVVASWGSTADHFPVGSCWTLEGRHPGALVFETGLPIRIDDYADASGPVGIGPLAAGVRETGIRSAVGSPIIVEGRRWGVIAAGSTLEQPLPADTEARLADFTKLLATAIANADSRAALAESRAALAASRTRIVAAADETRRRIERDLHDGTQQQLVSLILELRAARDAPHEVSQLTAQLARTERGLCGVLEELREISRGIHPAILSKGGLEPALRVLARRSALPVELDLRAERRLPSQIEVAAYYVASEALANAAKHAHASVVRVELDTHDAILQLAIRDNGIGGAEPAQGSGVVGLSDRIEALGGTLRLTSPPGNGTTLLVHIPIESQSSPKGPEP
jgi:signal transduction histidine kinase